MMTRTPKQQQTNTKQTSSCVKCVQPDNNEMIRCDTEECESWAHHSCLGIDEQLARQMEWFCDKCEVERQSKKRNECIVCKNYVFDPLGAIYCVSCNTAMHDKCAGFTLSEDNDWKCGPCTSKDSMTFERDDQKNSDQGHKKGESELQPFKRSNNKDGEQVHDKGESALQPVLLKRTSSKTSQRASSRRSEASFRSAASMTLTQSKIDNLREQRRLIDLKAKLLEQENELIDQQLENMTVASNDDDREQDFDENPMLDRFMAEQTQQSGASTNAANKGVQQKMLEKKQVNYQKPQSTMAKQDTIVQKNPALTLEQLTARQSQGNELPVFTGRPEEWPAFIAAFEHSTEACGFTDQLNLTRLQKAIKHPAKAYVENLMYHPSCVPRIIKTLKRNFAQPNQLFNSYLEKFKREPNPQQEKPETVMMYVSAVQNLWAVIEATNLSDHMSNPLVMSVLIEKLPQSLRSDWHDHMKKKGNGDMNVFVEFLDELADKICLMNPNMNLAAFAMKSTKPLEEPYVRKGVRRDAHTYYHDSEQTPQRSEACVACHRSCKSLPECRKFLEMEQQQRWDLIRSEALCKQCLRRHKLKPPNYYCASRIRCEEPGCNARHHRLIHRYRIEPTVFQDEPTTLNEGNEIDEPQLNYHRDNEHLLFRFVPVVIRAGNKTVNVGAFLDEGSSGTFIDEDLVKLLDVSGPTNPLCIHYTSNNYHCEDDSMKISVCVKGLGETREYKLNGVQTVKDLSLTPQSLDYASLSKKYEHLRGLKVESYRGLKPKLLIGLNNWTVAVPTEVKFGNTNDPIAARCKLGWTIFASLNQDHAQNIHYCNYMKEDERLDDLMKKYYSLESLGIQKPTYSTSTEDKRALRIMNDTIQCKDSRYEIGLLWQHDDVELPDSRNMALKRMYCLEARLRRDVSLAKAVKQQVDNLVEKGYARKVDPEELEQTLPRRWYLPIFPVTNVNKPGKVRLVFDAAAKANEVSLNSTLLKGPDQNSSLIGVLMRFRQRKVGLAGDIRDMFMRVKIQKPDCYSQLFLYRHDEREEPNTYVLESMSFGASSSPTCAQFVKNYNAEIYKEKYPRAVEAIVRNHYVDDLLDSVDTSQDAISLIEQVKFVHSKANFEIRGWKSNSPEVMKKYGDSCEQMSLQIDPEDEKEKVLGTWWCRSTDMLTFSLKFNKGNERVLAGIEPPTKREMLRILMSLYDPLGLLTHFTSILKVLMQDTWRSGTKWDEVIPDEMIPKWLDWLKMLWQVENVTIPRCYLKAFQDWNKNVTQLHIFVDASESCCAAVAYLRIQSEDTVEVSLVMARSKVAPIQLVSVPRLELVAALMGARLGNTVREALTIEIEDVYYWTDSTTVLSWIRSDTKSMKGQQYERFRAAEIQDTTRIVNWRYVPSKQNVADDATKINKSSLSSNDRWFHGPSFLYQPEDEWPTRIVVTKMPLAEVHVVDVQEFKPVIHFERYSNWDHLVRLVVVVRRYVRKLKNKCEKNKKEQVTKSSLVDDILKSEKQLFRLIQDEIYPSEIVALSKAKSEMTAVVDKKSKIRQLTPIFKDGLLRIGGRTEKVMKKSPYCQPEEFELVPYEEAANPIILPKKHPGTKLLIRKYHEKYFHVNHETVVNEMRQRFHISALRQVVKKMRKQCPTCKRLNAKANIPKMANLPQARLAVRTLPFTYVGVDCLGPFNVVVRRRPEKRWICLFTCLTLRAVHLEVLDKMDHDTFILAFRRFTARRGQPREVFSDNGTNFVKAERVLREEMKLLNFGKVEEALAMDGIKWHFNPPEGSHMGGSWERLVKSVKTAFYASMPSRSISDPLFHSLMVEIEHMLNSRPLTYIPIEHENQEALTPNHFLLQSSSGMKPLGQFSDDAVWLKTSFMNSQLYLKKFWIRWIKEYLPELTCRSKWFYPVDPLQIDDLVLIVDENKHNFDWQRGRVHEVSMAADGQVREAIIKTSTGYLKRPTVMLAKLDLEESGQKDESFRPPGGSVEKINVK